MIKEVKQEYNTRSISQQRLNQSSFEEEYGEQEEEQDEDLDRSTTIQIKRKRRRGRGRGRSQQRFNQSSFVKKEEEKEDGEQDEEQEEDLDRSITIQIKRKRKARGKARGRGRSQQRLNSTSFGKEDEEEGEQDEEQEDLDRSTKIQIKRKRIARGRGRSQQRQNSTSFAKEEEDGEYEEEEDLDRSTIMQTKRGRNGRGRGRGRGQNKSQSANHLNKKSKGVKQEALSKSISINIKQENTQPIKSQIDRPEKIIGMRYNKKNNKNQYLIKWVDYPENESTWESINNLKGCKILISLYLKEVSRQLPISDPLFSIPPMPNVEPIAIISIQDGYCWLSWPFREDCEKPDVIRVNEISAKQQYPQLYKERKQYEKSIKNGYNKLDEKLITIEEYSDDQALCVYDIRKGLCLLKVRNQDKSQLVWCDRKLVNPILILEYFSVQNWIYKL